MAASAGSDEPVNIFKLLLIGDSGVGKSSILLRFMDNKFEVDHSATIGVDYKIKFMRIDDQKVKLTVWDTAGQERFRTLTSSYYRGAHGVILVYDVTSRTSFEHLETWFNELEMYTSSKDVVKMIIGNQIDKGDEARQVTYNEGVAVARRFGTLFIECSAKTTVGIQQAFEELVHKILDTPALCQKKPTTQSRDANSAGNVDLSRTRSNEGNGQGGCAC